MKDNLWDFQVRTSQCLVVASWSGGHTNTVEVCMGNFLLGGPHADFFHDVLLYLVLPNLSGKAAWSWSWLPAPRNANGPWPEPQQHGVPEEEAEAPLFVPFHSGIFLLSFTQIASFYVTMIIKESHFVAENAMLWRRSNLALLDFGWSSAFCPQIFKFWGRSWFCSFSCLLVWPILNDCLPAYMIYIYICMNYIVNVWALVGPPVGELTCDVAAQAATWRKL